MIPGLLEDLTYLTVLDVGAHMPPKREIPKGISMKDPLLEQQKKEMQERVAAARQVVNELQAEQTAIKQAAPGDERDRYLAELAARLQVAQQALKAAQEEEQLVREWREKRDLEAAYAQVVSDLDEAAVLTTAARLAKGTVPRWFAALPCDSPFEVYSTERGDWGDKGERELVIRTPVLASNHLYPLERYFQQVAREQLAVGRRVMFYYEQSTIRSMAKRLEWVLKEFHPWTLPNGVEAEDRQQAILDAVKRGHKIVIVPYRKVNEGLNLQTAIDTIVWAELPMNLFYYTQASQRAWRLGKEKEVQIIIPYYIGSVAHQQVRRLGERDGAAAAFAGEPARGGLIHHAGADQTTLARLSAQIEEGTALLDSGQADDTAEIEAAFARRNEELAEALRRGRQWFGLTDTLPERLQTIMAAQYPPVWADMPAAVPLPEVSLETLKQLDEAIARRGDLSPVAPALPASALQGEVQQLILISPESVSSPEAIPAAVPLAAAPPISATVMVLGGALLFGNETDIARVRRQRGKQRPRLIPKPANPVVVRQIPALEMTQASTPASEPSLMLSIWDL